MINGINQTTPRFNGKLDKRIRQYQKHLKQEAVQKRKIRYQRALENYAKHPEIVYQFLQKPVYTDHLGAFTGKDLLDVLSKRLKREKIFDGIGMVVAGISIFGNIIYFDPEIREKLLHLKEEEFLDRFPEPVQDAVADSLKEMRKLGLVEYHSREYIKTITPLGKLFLK